MAINPNIPLQANVVVDPSQGIAQLANALQVRKQNDRQKELDAQSAKSQGIQDEANKLQIDAAKQKIAQSGKEGALKAWGADLVRIKSLADAGQLQQARHELIQRKANLVEQQINDPSVDTNDTDELINFIDQGNLEGFNAVVNSELSGLQSLGLLEGVSGKQGLASAKTELFTSGSIQAMPDGSVIVKDPQGNTVTGEDRTKVLAAIRQESIDKAQSMANIEVQKNRDIEQVKSAEKKATQAFDMVDKIRGNIRNLEEAARLSKDGANTGPIVSMFPSFKEESVRLDNMQKRLGLDVVGAVTFGALSKGELDLAKDVALPTNLTPEKLVKWIEDKIAAQKKLATYLEDQAIYLSQGHTNAEWKQYQREQKKIADSVIKSTGVSEQDINDTMKELGWTRQQVINELQKRAK